MIISAIASMLIAIVASMATTTIAVTVSRVNIRAIRLIVFMAAVPYIVL
jgi:hypothetical protein